MCRDRLAQSEYAFDRANPGFGRRVGHGLRLVPRATVDDDCIVAVTRCKGRDANRLDRGLSRNLSGGLRIDHIDRYPVRAATASARVGNAQDAGYAVGIAAALLPVRNQLHDHIKQKICNGVVSIVQLSVN